ncbi:MAG TPA: zinc ABC transporter substrate-binding protein, partial [Nitriliruptoraceae bacterium]|nr:zinc ABC transporter substrate-binding protein [Nitriliruptoraceae bacterium]
MHHTRALLPWFAVAAMVLAGCGSMAANDAGQDSSSASASTVAGSGEATDAGVTIVATTSILGDVVRNIVGEDAAVEVIMGPGVDPHGFAPSAAQAQSIREADLVVANGLQLEESLQDAMESAEQDGANVFRVAEGLDPVAFAARAGHDDHDDHDNQDAEDDAHDDEAEDDAHDDDHGQLDPHVWLDPQRMADGATL